MDELSFPKLETLDLLRSVEFEGESVALTEAELSSGLADRSLIPRLVSYKNPTCSHCKKETFSIESIF
jgi:hypothetical protein